MNSIIYTQSSGTLKQSVAMALEMFNATGVQPTWIKTDGLKLKWDKLNAVLYIKNEINTAEYVQRSM